MPPAKNKTNSKKAAKSQQANKKIMATSENPLKVPEEKVEEEKNNVEINEEIEINGEEEEEEEPSEIDSFVLDEENCEENSSDSTEDEDEEEIEDSDSDEEEEEDEEEEDSKFLLQNDDAGNSNFPVMDAETQAKIEALFDSAGIRKYDSVHITDPEELHRLTTSVSSALGEAAAALTRNLKTDPPSDGKTSLVDACHVGDVSKVRKLLDEGRVSVNDTTEEGESLLSLACQAGYYELAQVLLAMRANVEDRGMKGDNTPLMEAASSGHVDIVRLLIGYGADVNAQSSSGNTPLMYACASGHAEVTRALLENGAHVEDHNENGHTPLMEAASAGHVQVAKILLEYGAGINTHSNEFKESALTLACYKGHLEMVRFLLDAGADQEHKTDEMHTALMEASMDGHVEVARLLLDSGAQVNMPADSFESPLTLAACGGHVELAMLLLERGANIEEVNDEGYTPLMEAAREGHEEMVALLLSQGADINAQTEETQETALTLACCGGFLDVADFLIKAGADIELGASTPLMEASQEGHVDLVKYLLSVKCDVNAQTSTGDTALTFACERGHTDVADLLIVQGAQLEHESEGGRTPLMKAVRAGHFCTAKYLINKGADVNKPTANNDHTPLSLACAGGHVNLVELLLENGADPFHKLKDNSTMLIEAAKGGYTTVVSVLIDYNPQPLEAGRLPAEGQPAIMASSTAAASTTLASMPIDLVASTSSTLANSASVASASTALASMTLGSTALGSVTSASSPLANPPSVALNSTTVASMAATTSSAIASTTSSTLSSPTLSSATTLSSTTLGTATLSSVSLGSSSLGSLSLGSPALGSPALGSTNFGSTACSSTAVGATTSAAPVLGTMSLANAAMANLSLGSATLATTASVALANTAIANTALTSTTVASMPNKSPCVTTPATTAKSVLRKTRNVQLPPSIVHGAQPGSSPPLKPKSDSGYDFIEGSGFVIEGFEDKGLDAKSYIQQMLRRENNASSREEQIIQKEQILAELQRVEKELQEKAKNNNFDERNLANLPPSERPKAKPSRKIANVTEKGKKCQLQEALQQHSQQLAQLQQLQQLNQQLQQQVLQQRQLKQQNQATLAALQQNAIANQQQLAALQHNVAQLQSLEQHILAQQSFSQNQQQRVAQILQQKQQLQRQIKLFQEQVELQLAFTQPTNDEALVTSGSNPEQQPKKTTKRANLDSKSAANLGSAYELVQASQALQAVQALNTFDSEDSIEPLAQDPALLIASLAPFLPSANADSASDPYYGNSQDFARAVQVGLQGNPELARAIQAGPYNLSQVDSGQLQSNFPFLDNNFPGPDIIPGYVPVPVPVGLPEPYLSPPVAAEPEVPAEVVEQPSAEQEIVEPNSSNVDLDSETDSNHDTALTLACAGGHEELVNLLISRGANIEHRDKKGFTPLILAATAGHDKVCEILLDHNADIEAQSERTKDTPLSLACSGGRYEVVEVLLRRNANKEHRNVSDYTPLALAASGGYVNIIKLLLAHGAEINSRTGSKLGISPLMLAAMNGHTASVRLLLDMGSDINAQIETNRNTALTLACFQGRHEVVSLLLDRKANVEHRAKTGLTPLMEAASGGFVEVGRVLLDKWADVNAPPVPSSRDTALTIAADKGHYRFVELLLARGAQVDVRNKKGNSSLWLAANGGHLDVVQLLHGSGADIDSQDNRKISCLMAAFRKGHSKVVKWMVKSVSQFPSDNELTRFINTITDKDLLKKCQNCMDIIEAAKDRQAEEAARNANNLLEELIRERSLEESKKAAAARKREKKKRKKMEKLAEKGLLPTDNKENNEDDVTTEDEKEKTPPHNQDSGIDANSQASSFEQEIVVSTENNTLKEAAANKKAAAATPTTITKGKGKKVKKVNEVTVPEPAASTTTTTITMEKKSLVTTNGNNEVVKKRKEESKAKPVNEKSPNNKKSGGRNTASSANAVVLTKDDAGWKEVIRKSKKVIVPANAISRVIGRAGCNINAIREMSGAHIEVEKLQGGPKVASGQVLQTERTILIKGSAEATRQAHNWIQQIINNPDKDMTDILGKAYIKSTTAAAAAAAAAPTSVAISTAASKTGVVVVAATSSASGKVTPVPKVEGGGNKKAVGPTIGKPVAFKATAAKPATSSFAAVAGGADVNFGMIQTGGTHPGSLKAKKAKTPPEQQVQPIIDQFELPAPPPKIATPPSTNDDPKDYSPFKSYAGWPVTAENDIKDIKSSFGPSTDLAAKAPGYRVSPSGGPIIGSTWAPPSFNMERSNSAPGSPIGPICPPPPTVMPTSSRMPTVATSPEPEYRAGSFLGGRSMTPEIDSRPSAAPSAPSRNMFGVPSRPAVSSGFMIPQETLLNAAAQMASAGLFDLDNPPQSTIRTPAPPQPSVGAPRQQLQYHDHRFKLNPNAPDFMRGTSDFLPRPKNNSSQQQYNRFSSNLPNLTEHSINSLMGQSGIDLSVFDPNILIGRSIQDINELITAAAPPATTASGYSSASAASNYFDMGKPSSSNSSSSFNSRPIGSERPKPLSANPWDYSGLYNNDLGFGLGPFESPFLNGMPPPPGPPPPPSDFMPLMGMSPNVSPIKADYGDFMPPGPPPNNSMMGSSKMKGYLDMNARGDPAAIRRNINQPWTKKWEDE